LALWIAEFFWKFGRNFRNYLPIIIWTRSGLVLVENNFDNNSKIIRSFMLWSYYGVSEFS